jgi:bifunctional UDP-N-acetylglucosamine pyrophosphorylase / glucosamine-1-phosphate N-acetyltransferase
VRSTRCALIPAAGRGTRLGLDIPKLLAPIGKDSTVWSILRGKLLDAVDRIHLVVAPQWAGQFDNLLKSDPQAERLSCSVQEEPRGMGDAIFGAAPHWADSKTLLIVWGDQVHISPSTIARTIVQHHGPATRNCTIPVVRLDRPYVQFCFNAEDQLIEIRETREGAVCDARGYSDVGTFALEVDGLQDAWRAYNLEGKAGALTGEINFLPFLPYLARNGWRIRRVVVEDKAEARGINSPEDLKYFQELYSGGQKARSVAAHV